MILMSVQVSFPYIHFKLGNLDTWKETKLKETIRNTGKQNLKDLFLILKDLLIL